MVVIALLSRLLWFAEVAYGLTRGTLRAAGEPAVRRCSKYIKESAWAAPGKRYKRVHDELPGQYSFISSW